MVKLWLIWSQKKVGQTGNRGSSFDSVALNSVPYPQVNKMHEMNLH